MSWHCALTAQKANQILGYIQRNTASRSKEVILPLCSSLVRPHRQCCIQVRELQSKKDMEGLEQVQRGNEVDNRTGEPVLQRQAEKVGAVQLREEKAAWGTQEPSSIYREAGEGLFVRNCRGRTRGNGYNLEIKEN